MATVIGGFWHLRVPSGVDPTPAAICMQETPRIHAWTDIVDDLAATAGAEDWINLQDSADHLKELLSEIGRVYAPALLANAKALQAGEQTMTTTIDGQLGNSRHSLIRLSVYNGLIGVPVR